MVTELGDGRWVFAGEDLLNPEKHWDFQQSAAQSGDAWCLSNPTWVPPNAAALVAAARRTELCGFFPFTAHQYLSFSDGPTWWKPGGGQIAPACISQDPDHGYVVWDGGPYDGGRNPVLRTQDPDEAANEVARLLAGWPSPAEGSTGAQTP
ncbi:hypothetical protein GCM10023191_009920 [Actinoallomurus oryzae]|uniref:Uncharacterized protein n=1 Tax=Actinoallomurus oryzae TaxID=502180 RepID=A0ABP8PBU5_9ACTN